MSGAETRAADGVSMPTDVGKHAVRVITAGAAQIVDLRATWGSYPAVTDPEARWKSRTAYVTIKVKGGDVYLRFRQQPAPGASLPAAATSASNGFPVNDGETVGFWVDAAWSLIDLFGAGTVTLYMSSEEF